MTDAIARGTSPIGENLAAAWDHNGHGPATESQLGVAVEAAEYATSALRSHHRNNLMAALDPEDLGADLGPEQVRAVVDIVRALDGKPQQTQIMP